MIENLKNFLVFDELNKAVWHLKIPSKKGTRKFDFIRNKKAPRQQHEWHVIHRPHQKEKRKIHAHAPRKMTGTPFLRSFLPRIPSQ